MPPERVHGPSQMGRAKGAIRFSAQLHWQRVKVGCGPIGAGELPVLTGSPFVEQDRRVPR